MIRFLVKRVFLVMSFALFPNLFLVGGMDDVHHNDDADGGVKAVSQEVNLNAGLIEKAKGMYVTGAGAGGEQTYVYLCRYGLEACDCMPDALGSLKAKVATDCTCCCGSCKNEGGLAVGFITVDGEEDFQGVPGDKQISGEKISIVDEESMPAKDKQSGGVLWSAFVRFSPKERVTCSPVRKVDGQVSFSYADGEEENLVNIPEISQSVILRKEYVVKGSGDRYLSSLVKILQTSLFCWKLGNPKQVKDIIGIIGDIGASGYNYTGVLRSTHNCASFSVELLNRLDIEVSIPKSSFFNPLVCKAVTTAMVGGAVAVVACGFPWLLLVGLSTEVLYGAGYLYCGAVRPSKVIEAVLNTGSGTKNAENFWAVMHRRSLDCDSYEKMRESGDNNGGFYLQKVGAVTLEVPSKQGRFLLGK
jgi:hypothetical protein